MRLHIFNAEWPFVLNQPMADSEIGIDEFTQFVDIDAVASQQSEFVPFQFAEDAHIHS